jgi:hypothetical protein
VRKEWCQAKYWFNRDVRETDRGAHNARCTVVCTLTAPMAADPREPNGLYQAIKIACTKDYLIRDAYIDQWYYRHPDVPAPLWPEVVIPDLH